MTTDVDDELWSAAADPSRRRIVDLLVTHGPASASWLAGRVPFSRQAVAKHLAVLEHAGLVERRRQGREVLYLVDPQRLDRAARAMAEIPRGGGGSATPRRRRRRPRTPCTRPWCYLGTTVVGGPRGVDLRSGGRA